jgi:hypothetical protein
MRPLDEEHRPAKRRGGENPAGGVKRAGGGEISRKGGERRGGEPSPRKAGRKATKDGENPKTGGRQNSPPKTDLLIPGVVTPKKPNTEQTLN